MYSAFELVLYYIISLIPSINRGCSLASGQKMEGFKGRKFFARERSPAARASARSRAEKFSFPFRRKNRARKKSEM